MAEYTVEAGNIGAYEQALEAETVDTVVFDQAVAAVEIWTDGSAAIYLTTDGTDPAVKGQSCHAIPAFPAVRTLALTNSPSSSLKRTIKLISEGTPTYSVAAAPSSGGLV